MRFATSYPSCCLRFNLKALCGRESTVLWGDVDVISKTGGKQGDPLASILWRCGWCGPFCCTSATSAVWPRALHGMLTKLAAHDAADLGSHRRHSE